MSSKFDQFQARNVELAALDQLKKSFTLKLFKNILMTCWLSGERLLPFGLLVLMRPKHIDANRYEAEPKLRELPRNYQSLL